LGTPSNFQGASLGHRFVVAAQAHGQGGIGAQRGKGAGLQGSGVLVSCGRIEGVRVSSWVVLLLLGSCHKSPSNDQGWQLYAG